MQLMDDLRWLGIDWDAGPDREDERGPYRQSSARAIYARHFDALASEGPDLPVLLHAARARSVAQDAARGGQAAALCGHVPRAARRQQRERKRAAGIAPTLRFRVPSGRRIEFEDFVHGAQSFLSDDIGDFVIRRADGSPRSSSAMPWTMRRMGVTHVLRGEDHLTNTPRQL